MKKLFEIIVVCILCLIANNTFAVYITPQEALNIADKILSSKQSGFSFRAPSNVKSELSIASQSEAYYVINVGTNGFLIISADDELPELLGYSKERIYCEESISPALRMWLNNYDREIQIWRNTISYHNKRLVNRSQNDGREPIDPLLSTKWGQDFPFNNYCPTDCQGKKCPIGCVTTAIAQIMNYWEWPQKGYGEHSFEYICTEDSTDRRILSVNLESTQYHWENMVDDYGFGGQSSVDMTTSDQQDAVATLMYHIAVAQNAHFSYQGTWLSFREIRQHTFPSLFSHFDYDNNVQVFAKDYCNIDSLETFLYDELLDGRPIFVVGADSAKGGHAFVCDGYENHYFHFNWGWNGLGDGWFRLSALNPSMLFVGSYEFNSFVQFFTGIKPKKNQSPIKHYGNVWVADEVTVSPYSYEKLPDDLIYESPFINIYEVKIEGMANASITNHTGFFNIALYPCGSDEFVQLITSCPACPFPDEHDFFYGEMKAAWPNFETKLSQDLASGEYSVVPVYTDKQGKWVPISLLNGKSFPTIKIQRGIRIGEPASIYTTMGQLVYRTLDWQGLDSQLPSGLYLVKRGTDAIKLYKR